MQRADGEAAVNIVNLGPDVPRVSNTLDGSFTELHGRVGLRNRAGNMEGFVEVESLSGGGYDSLGGSVGFRLMW